MCGINGFIRTTKEYVAPGIAADKAMRDLLYFTRLRGTDAFGVFKQSYHNNGYALMKDVGEPLALVNEGPFKNFISQSDNNRYYVMHNRHATRGKKEDIAGAHPYQEAKENGKGSIILVHNGTITTNNLEKEFPGVTDSHSLTKMIAAGMPLSDIEAAIWGAWALVWLDTEDNTLHFWRNKERPFGFVFSDKSIFFGSELYMVAAAMDRQDIKVDKLMRFPIMEEWVWHKDGKSFDKKEVKLKVKKAGVNKAYHPPNGFLNGDGDDLSGFTAADSQQGGSKSTASSQTKVLPFLESPIGLPAPSHSSVGFTNTRSTRYSRKTAATDRFRRIKTFGGWQVGDSVTFTLTDFSATKRGTQVKLEGCPVIFYENAAQSPLRDITIHAMTSLKIEDLDTKKVLYRGIVTELFGTDKVPYLFKMSLRDVVATAHDDLFREKEEIIALPKPLAPSPFKPKESAIPSWLQQPRDSLPTSIMTNVTKSILRRERKDSSGLEYTLKDCYNCGATEKKRAEHHRVVESSLAEDFFGKEFFLCRECFVSTTCDESLLQRLFQQSRMEQLNNELTGPTQQFVHEQVTTVQ